MEPWHLAYAELEAGCAEIFEYGPRILPGLLQTPEYTRIRLMSSRELIPPEERRHPRPHVVHGPRFLQLSRPLASLVTLVTTVGAGAGVMGLLFGTSQDLFALVALVVLVLRRLGLGLVPERAASARASRVEGPDWELIADAAMRRNDLREATRAMFHVLVGTLATRRILPDEPSTTAGECRAAVARSEPGLYPSVSRATDAFERVAYGGADPDRSDVEAIRIASREAAR